MLALGLFPNAKEVTESYGAYNAVESLLTNDFKNPEISVVCPGDGHKPRTGATFALRTNWNCVSVDPQVRKESWPIRRLQVHKKKIEDVSLEFDHPVIIVCVHSHCTLQACLRSISAPQISIVAIPCCVKLHLGNIKPDYEYHDENIWSKENVVRIWKDIIKH